MLRERRPALPTFPLVLWLGLRLLSSFVAAFASGLRPITILEQQMSLWPPGRPFSLWLERVLIAPWERWDALWYARIVAFGYAPDDGTAQFHPLYPWLAVPLARLGLPPVLALLVVSTLAALAALIVFHRLAEREVGPLQAPFSTLLFATFPVAFVLFAPYPEALFLLWTTLTLMWAREGRWWAAGAAGGLAALTRQQGIFLALPLAWELWAAHRRAEKGQRPPAWYEWTSLLLIPLGYGLWTAYRFFVLRDASPDLSSPNRLIYSLLISPSASQVVPNQAFLWPWEALRRAVLHLFRTGDIATACDLILGGFFIVLTLLAWRHLRGSDQIYVAAVTLVAFSYYTGPLHPYMGLPRHLLLALPIFLPLGKVLRRRWLRWMGLSLHIFGWMFMTLLYGLHAWVL